MSHTAPPLAPRSAGASVDTELLRAALTDVAGSGAAAPLSIADRIRSFLLRFARTDAAAA